MYEVRFARKGDAHHGTIVSAIRNTAESFTPCGVRKSFRAISIARLYIAVIHLRPINVVVYDGPR